MSRYRGFGKLVSNAFSHEQHDRSYAVLITAPCGDNELVKTHPPCHKGEHANYVTCSVEEECGLLLENEDSCDKWPLCFNTVMVVSLTGVVQISSRQYGSS
jgi:hypothetical protein